MSRSSVAYSLHGKPPTGQHSTIIVGMFRPNKSKRVAALLLIDRDSTYSTADVWRFHALEVRLGDKHSFDSAATGYQLSGRIVGFLLLRAFREYMDLLRSDSVFVMGLTLITSAAALDMDFL